MVNVNSLHLLVVASVLCLTTGTACAQKSVITFSHENAIGGLVDQTAQKFKQLVEAKTAKVEVRVHPAAQLGDDQRNIEGMKLGTIHMTISNPDYLAKRVPDYVVFTLPYMFKDYRHVERVMDSEVSNKLDQMLLAQRGIRTLAWGHNGFRNMLTRDKPMRSLADFKGMKFRSPAIPVYMKMFQAIGANPTPIPWPEAYPALKQGVVDGLEVAPEGLVQSGIEEMIRYITLTNHLYTAMILLVDDKYFQGLPPNVRKAIVDAAAELQPWQRKMVIETTNSIFDKLRQKGVVINEIDTREMVTAVKPVWKELSGGAPNAQQFMDRVSQLRD